jgi:hypothetical protein
MWNWANSRSDDSSLGFEWLNCFWFMRDSGIGLVRTILPHEPMLKLQGKKRPQI